MPAQTQGSSDACKREKYWNELNAHERVERMREVVKAQGRIIKELKEQVGTLMEHCHNNNGKITVPLEIIKEKRNPYQIGPIEFRRLPTPEENEKAYF